jgi:hypothetical protein
MYGYARSYPGFVKKKNDLVEPLVDYTASTTPFPLPVSTSLMIDILIMAR